MSTRTAARARAPAALHFRVESKSQSMAAEGGRVCAICFSKDRPYQLNEFLRTLLQYISIQGQTPADSMDIFVIYKSDEKWRRLYGKVRMAFSTVQFIEEKDFGEDLKRIVFTTECEYVMFGVDDSLFYDSFDLKHALMFLSDSNLNAFAFHFRLHPSICYSHTAGQSLYPLPPFKIYPSEINGQVAILMYEREKGNLDWNYPWELCSSVYRTEVVQSMINRIGSKYEDKGLSHPNLLEFNGSRIVHHKEFQHLARCAVPNTRISTVLTINRVQDVFKNDIYANAEGDLSILNTRLDIGSNIDAPWYRTPRIPSAHYGILRFAKRGDTKGRDEPLVSVVMPVYNSEKFVAAAVQSVLDQTYRNLELIIVLDGPTDNSGVIVENLALQDTRIMVVKNHSNRGIAESLNIALQRARGKYVARMDSDDVSLQNRFEKQVYHMEANPSVNVLGTAIVTISEDGAPGSVKTFPTTAGFTYWQLLFGCYVAHPTVMMRAELFEDTDLLYDSAYTCAEDYDLWLRIQLKYPGSIVSLGMVLLCHRIHPGSASHEYTDQQHQETEQLRKRMRRELCAPGQVELGDDECGKDSLSDPHVHFRVVEALAHSTIGLLSQIQGYSEYEMIADRKLIEKDAMSRRGEIAFRCMLEDDAQLWTRWAKENPGYSRVVFDKLMSCPSSAP